MTEAGTRPTGRGQRVAWEFGGPVMIVRGFPDDVPGVGPIVACAWFTPDGYFHKADFPASELRVVPEPTGRAETT